MKKIALLSTREVIKACPVCQYNNHELLIQRGDGVNFLECGRCNSLFLERIPENLADLYNDNYFALNESSKFTSESISDCGYAKSYDDTYLDTEFYWAFRIADQAHKWYNSSKRGKSCLDIGAATGRLLNIFKESGYQTNGIELSTPAKIIAESKGHIITSTPLSRDLLPQNTFDVITALEVIEHVDDIPGFLICIQASLAKGGVFLGYFPSANSKAFTSSISYHWLHNSFEHLTYPSDLGIEKLASTIFGDNVFTATFLTTQGKDVIPNTIILACNAEEDDRESENIIELFGRLNYLNYRDQLCKENGNEKENTNHNLVKDALRKSAHNDGYSSLMALICAKFGNFDLSHLVLNNNPQIYMHEHANDLYAMALHGGQMDWLSKNLESQNAKYLMKSVKDDCAKALHMYMDKLNYNYSKAQEDSND